nr:hypothetical protein [Pleurocapsa sp. FMAR1]
MTNNTISIEHTFKLGGDLTVNRLGYGAMRLSGQPGNFSMRPRVDVRRKGRRIGRRISRLGRWRTAFTPCS